MSEILVTGASGFIGSHIVPRLRAGGHSVIAVDVAAGDVADASTWSAVRQVDVVVHLAARSFVPDSWRMAPEYLRTNIVGTANALEYCRVNGAHLVFLSSYMYGEPEILPISESSSIVARNPYALSKKLAEEACRFYAENWGTSVTVFRPFNVYGPGQAEPFLVPYILRQIAEREMIRVKDLGPRRDYVYVKDVVDAIVLAVGSAGDGFHVYNLGSGASHSVEELIALIQAVAKTALAVVPDGERRQDEIMETVADISAARGELGWSPRFTLREGLEDMAREAGLVAGG
jgi:nucleoside-diphosphate-sugar epimerase